MTIDHQNQTNAHRRVLILAFPDVLMMDIAGPAQVFGSANKLLQRSAYGMSVVTSSGRDAVTDTGLSIGASLDFSGASHVDDFVIPGGPGVDSLMDDAPTLSFIQTTARRSDRTLSICSGSLLAAAAGILDGRRATSHWERSDEIFQRFPQVNWQLDHIFTRDGKHYCSAGVTAGIDLALSILEYDHGRQLALDVAREMVVFIRRNGGQSQYSRPLQAQSSSSRRVSELSLRIETDPAGDWTVHRMAALTGTTERTLHRDFVRDLKVSPSRFVEERRVGIARTYLERSRKTLKEIAVLSGFATEQRMRRSFQRLLGILPGEYKQRFGDKPAET